MLIWLSVASQSVSCLFFVCSLFFVDLAACLFVCFSIQLFVCNSVCLFLVCLSVGFVCLFVCLSVCLCLFLRLSVCLSVCLFVCLSVCFSLFVCPFVCLSVCFSVCLSVCLFICQVLTLIPYSHFIHHSDEARGKMLALRERADKELAQHTMDMKVYNIQPITNSRTQSLKTFNNIGTNESNRLRSKAERIHGSQRSDLSHCINCIVDTVCLHQIQ